MRQAVMEATKGRKDYFLVNPNIPKFASFAFEFPMEGHIAAMFGDDKSGYFEKGMRNYIEMKIKMNNWISL